MLKAKTKEALHPQIEIDETTADIVLDYAISGMIAVYQQWFNSDRRQSIEEISSTISILFFQGFSGILEREEKGNSIYTK